MINFKAIGTRIRQLRKNHSLTQEKLAEMLNVSTEHLSRIETGSIRPGLSFIEKICNIFNIDESELMFGNKSEIILDKKLYEAINGLSEEKKKAVLAIVELLK